MLEDTHGQELSSFELIAVLLNHREAIWLMHAWSLTQTQTAEIELMSQDQLTRDKFQFVCLTKLFIHRRLHIYIIWILDRFELALLLGTFWNHWRIARREIGKRTVAVE